MKRGWFCADTAQHSGSGLFSTPSGVWVAVTHVVDDNDPQYDDDDAIQSGGRGFYVGPVIDHIANIPPRPWPNMHGPYRNTIMPQDGPRELHINGRPRRVVFVHTTDPIHDDWQRAQGLNHAAAHGRLPFDDDE